MKRHFPFPAYPNGWFVVEYSNQLEVSGVLPLEYFGRQLVLFRDEHGTARVLDAHCRHLGAHLAFGGVVEGTGIRCPFHAWLWNGDGKCTDIPYAKRIPKGAEIRSWDVCERNGFIYLWYHAAAAPPEYEVPELEEYASEEWGDYTRLRWKVRSRMYDMGENAVDHVHFKYLHGAMGAPTDEQKVAADGSVSNFSRMKMVTPKGPIEGSIESKGIGPGIGTVWVKGIVDTVIVTNSTPIDEDHVDVRFSYLQRTGADERLQRIGRKMIENLKGQMEQDIVVFEHKTYWTKPLLVPEDGPIAKYRKTARKHYTGAFFGDDEQESR
jgi:3-ketosteroid 9alpha-monooxygenase subunit A